MAERGITEEIAEQIYVKLAAFANYGFPESHSVSFAYLVYASSWIKLHYPAAFCAALLNAQPMGFYSPHSLVQDARRHGVVVHTPDINRSRAVATLEPCPGSHREVAVRLGLGAVRKVGADLAERLAGGQPYASMEEVARRADASLDVLEALATAGAFDTLVTVSPAGPPSSDPPSPRRAALWAAGAVAQARPGRLAGIVTGVEAPALPGMSEREVALADLWASGVAPEGHPTRFHRAELEARGVVTAAALKTRPTKTRVLVAGVVTHRQRPATAGGTTFLNLEDETGLINVIVSKGCWQRHLAIARSAPALLVRGRLENVENVVNVIAERLELLPIGAASPSRDFR
jgi:error-prone DNA polymerase